MKLNKTLERKLRGIGAKIDAKVKEADALIAEARSVIGFFEPKCVGLLEYKQDADNNENCSVFTGKWGQDLVQYAQNALLKWERDKKTEQLQVEIKRLGITKDMLFPSE